MRKITIHPATINIKNLTLRTIIGFNDWERKKLQNVILNISVQFDASKAVASDSPSKTLDYKKLKSEIIAFVEKSRYKLLETLTSKTLQLIMKNPQAISASVKIDKPHALRFAESVSVEMHADRPS